MAVAKYPGRWCLVVGGAGKSAAEYKQAAKFVSFLLSPEMQVEMVRIYGGLPLTRQPALPPAARSCRMATRR